MGTGSFGGGSGSYGGGGSGSSGSGSSSSSGGKTGGGSKAGRTGRRRKGTGSVAELVASMLKLSRDVNSDPTLPAARKRLYELLQDRGRRDYFIGTLTSPVVQGVFNDLLATAPKPDTPIDWISAAARYRLDAATTPLAALARAIVREHRKPPADERHVEVVRLVLADIFLKAVNNDLGRYQNTALANLGEGFDAAVLRSVSGHYLAGLMRRVVRQDLMELSTEMQISMETASYNIADAWYARFENDYFEGRRRADVLNVIATNYADFAQIRQEFVNAGARQ